MRWNEATRALLKVLLDLGVFLELLTIQKGLVPIIGRSLAGLRSPGTDNLDWGGKDTGWTSCAPLYVMEYKSINKDMTGSS